MGIDSVRLREDLAASQREGAHLGAALAKANAKIEHLTGTRLLSTYLPSLTAGKSRGIRASCQASR